MAWDGKLLFLGATGLLGLFILGSAFLSPVKIILRAAIAFGLGGIILILANLVGGFFHFQIAINPATIFITGLFPLPGLFLLVLLTFFMS